MRLAIGTLAILLAFDAAARDRPRLDGDGQVRTEPRQVGTFTAVRLETAADVAVRVGPQPSVAVTIDGNLQPHLVTEVKGGVLVIRADANLKSRSDAKVEVALPELRRFDLAGAGDVAIEGGSGPLELGLDGSGDLRWRGDATSLRVSIEGSGDVSLEGKADRLTARIEGSGDIRAGKLAAKDAEASVEGSGDIDLLLAGGRLVAKVEGSGDIRWRGQASVEQAAVHGSGEISRRE
jgi:hypothetical protein